MLESSQDQLVVALLFAGRHLLDSAVDRVQDESGRLTTAEISVLMALHAFPSATQTELTAIVGRDKTTLSRTLARLDEKDLLTARIDPVDGRRRTLELSETATELADSALRSVTARLGEMLSSLTQDELGTCFRLMEVFLKDLLVA